MAATSGSLRVCIGDAPVPDTSMLKMFMRNGGDAQSLIDCANGSAEPVIPSSESHEGLATRKRGCEATAIGGQPSRPPRLVPRTLRVCLCARLPLHQEPRDGWFTQFASCVTSEKIFVKLRLLAGLEKFPHIS